MQFPSAIDQGAKVNALQSARTPSYRAGLFATLGTLLRGKGSSAPSRRRLAALSSLTLFLVLALTPASASAVTIHAPLGFSPITGSGSGVTIHFPSGIAVDEISGNVFLNDGGLGNVVDILGAEGGAPSGLLSPFTITGFEFNFEPSGAAVDNFATSPSKGALYVTDVENFEVKKFVRNPGTQKYEAVGELTPTSPPGFEFEYPMGDAVDKNGNVFVTDYGSESVVKFSPTGTQLARISTSATVGSPSSVALDGAGDLFVQGYENGRVYKYTANGSGDIEPTAVTTQIVSSDGTGVAVDPAANALYVALGNHVNQYNTTTLAKQEEFGAGTLGTTTRLAVNSANGRIYVADSSPSKNNVAVFGSFKVPGVISNPATGITAAKATLNGSVNPDGVAVTECKFEYLTDAAFIASGGTPAKPATGYSGSGANAPITKACVGAIPTDASDHPVSTEASGLNSATTYHFRLVAKNANNILRESEPSDRTFTTPESNKAETEAASGVGGATATLNGVVFPKNLTVTECKFEYLTKAAYEAAGNSYNGTGANAPATKLCPGVIPTDNLEHPVAASIAHLIPNGTTYHFRIAIDGEGGPVKGVDKTFTTQNTFTTAPASSVTDTTATLNGAVKLEGDALTECKFEYLTNAAFVANGNSYSGANAPATKACTPAFGSISNDAESHPVTADLTLLAKNTTYHFRLVAQNAFATMVGVDQAFTTLGPPQITEELASLITGTTATLQAKVNPSGTATSYRFEWGTSASYDHRVPAEFDLFAGSGTSPVNITANLAGLALSTTYHFRVVATNSFGAANGPDVAFITNNFTALNSAGLPDNRSFELVSPANKRPQGEVRAQFGTLFLNSQVAEDGQSLLFPLLNGLEDTSSGGDTSYLATRHESGWQSTKISPPSLVSPPSTGGLGSAASGRVVYNSPDLSCGVINTFNPLTDDTPTADVELGVYNLYRRNPDGSHMLVTNTVPANPGIPTETVDAGTPNVVAGASEDCSRIYFRSEYQYLPNPSGLYEWDEGTLRDAGRLPNGATPVGGAALGGEPLAAGGVGSRVNSVSHDGSRFFFTALSNAGGDSGKQAVFARKGPAETVDVSLTQGGANNSLGARYQTASPDGSHVFFTATYGLTASSSSGPAENCSGAAVAAEELGAIRACDLYDYNVGLGPGAGTLTDLSADSNQADPKGAVVLGVVAVSKDGSSVYFAARGQLVTGKGKTYAENISGAGSANLYLARGSQLSYVATVDASLPPNGNNSDLLVRAGGWKADATPDGDHFLFPSRANVTGYDSGGAVEAYLYSADTGTIQCVSCKPVGSGSVGGVSLLQSFPHGLNFQSQPRKMSDDGDRVFFGIGDILAPGAVSGNVNLYEWERGQVYFLASGIGPQGPQLYGASNSGDDVFFSTPQQLDPRYDTDFVRDAYDARVGGGFPDPPPPPQVCDVASSECQGSETPQPAGSSPTSQSSSGEGNPPLQPPRCPKGKVHKHGKCVPRKHHREKAQKRNHSRAANTNRGGAK
jgi:hypothetical protein